MEQSSKLKKQEKVVGWDDENSEQNDTDISN
jgi:hypothetical protein